MFLMSSIQQVRNTSTGMILASIINFHTFLIFLFVFVLTDETPPEHQATLTHVIPLINKTCCNVYAKSNYLWKNALFRLVKGKPDLWGHGLKCFLIKHHPLPSSSSSSSSDHHVNDQIEMNQMKEINEKDEKEAKMYTLVIDAGKLMEHLLQTHDGYFSYNFENHDDTATTVEDVDLTKSVHKETKPMYMELYCHVLIYYIKYTAPLFRMPGVVQLGIPIRLHLFEPRYRLLIGEVMSKFPQEYKTGIEIPNEEDDDDKTNMSLLNNGYSTPTFLYANKPLHTGNTAMIVEVRRCAIHPNDTADVELIPIQCVRIETVWERPHSNRLSEARVIKMSNEEYKKMMEKSMRGGGSSYLSWNFTLPEQR